MVSRLPNWCADVEFAFSAIREPALDEVRSALDCLARGQQQVDVVRHEHKRMEKKFSSAAVVFKRVEEQGAGSICLEQSCLAPRSEKEGIPIESRYEEDRGEFKVSAPYLADTRGCTRA